MEFRIWTELIQQSQGGLHVFLPLLDRGLDAVIHRFGDGEYIPVQVKGRGETVDGMVEIVIPGDRLVDDRAVLIAGLITDDGLGPVLLVIDEGTFKHLAARDLVQGFEVYSAAFSMHPRSSHWEPYLVPRELLAVQLMGALPPSMIERELAAPGIQPEDRHNQWLGFVGESEVVRRLADNPRLDLFRPFPDLEMVEVLARDNVNGQFVGLQVKAAVPGEYGEAHIHVRKSTFAPAPSTWVAGLAWLPEGLRFAEECLLIPTKDLSGVAVDDGDRWAINFHPTSRVRTPVDPYRIALAELGAAVGAVTSGA